MRLLLVLFASASGYFIILKIVGSKLAYAGIISGLLIAIIAILFEERVRKTPLRIVAGGAIGLIAGLIVANLLTYPLTSFSILNDRYLELAAYLFTNSVVGYIGLSIGMKKGDELEGFSLIRHNKEETQAPAAAPAPLGSEPEVATNPGILLDTSVIIDGRIAEVCDTGFLESKITVPQFVLHELQYIADSSDPIKRTRGKRGLDILQQIQSNPRMNIVITDMDFPAIKEVDSKLVALAKELGARILTNDSNLHKIAELQGLEVLNMNKLATAMKPVVLPGEIMTIQVLKEGKEHGQGVGYLEDGTMVVIDNAREFLGKTIDVSITSVLQTTGGRMIFSKVKDDYKKAAFQ